MSVEVETAADFGQDEAGKARRWISELDQSIKVYQPYWKRCDAILQRYEDERGEESRTARKFSIFWSNIETLKPACYARVPQAVVLRRNNDPDPIARVSAEVLERAINFSHECYDFDQVLKDVRDEFLLLAKGQNWARYVPTFGEAPQVEGVDEEAGKEPEKPGLMSGMLGAIKGMMGNGQEKAQPPAQVVTYEEAVTDYVSYQDWGTNKCRKWSEVRFVWRKCYMDREALKNRFTKAHSSGRSIGELIPLDFKPKDSEGEQYAQAVIYEIWDKPSKKAIWVSKSFTSAVLDERADPLGLKDFFPCSKPAYGTTSPRSIIPIPDYVQYQDQCEEVDDLTARISKITKALILSGVYAGDEKDALQNLLDPKNENKIIPIEGWQQLADKGGLKGIIEYTPVEQIYNVLKGLYEARERAVEIIYQITGISDIMRGDTDPNETAAAQGLKSTWGSSRVREKQKEIARFARDCMGMTGEIIASKFSIDTLKVMTNYQLLTQAEKQLIEMWQQATAQLEAQAKQQQAMMAQGQQAQPGMPPQPQMPQPPPMQPPPPPFPREKMELIKLPTWEDVDGLLKANGLRRFRIDIEADSTVEPDLVSDKRDATEYLTAMGNLFAGALPLVQQLPPLAKPIGSIINSVNRKFNMGREVEEEFASAMEQIAAMPPQQPEAAQKGKSPEELAIEQQKVQVAAEGNKVKMAAIDADKQNSQFDAQTNAANAKAELDRVAMEERNARMDQMMERMLAFLDSDTRIKEAGIEANTRRYEADRDHEARHREADATEKAASAKKPVAAE